MAGFAGASFGDLLPERLGARLRPDARIISARPRQTIVGFGALSTEVYILLRGRAQVALLSHTGREVILRTLGPGGVFGELAAIDELPRSASIVAISAVELAVVSGSHFRRALEEVPGAAMWMLRRLTAQVRSLTDKVFELNVLAVCTRIHCELLRLCIEGQCNDATCTIEPAPTHAELAARVGTHREAVTREMRYLAGRGILEQKRRRLTILNVPALADIVRKSAGELEVVSLVGGGAESAISPMAGA